MRGIVSNLFIESMEQFSVAVEESDSRFWKVRKDCFKERDLRLDLPFARWLPDGLN